MKKGEPRFFLNWQMPTTISKALYGATSDAERSSICQSWLHHTGIDQNLEVGEATNTQMGILQQFTDMNSDFAKKQNFSEKKMACFMEIMHYMMVRLVKDRCDEDASFEIFKELLLRHSIQRPSYSLAIFTLADCKAIDLFALDTFYRHYDMYLYALTVNDNLNLKCRGMQTQEVQKVADLGAAKEVDLITMDALQDFLSGEEKEAIAKQKEYMERGPGRVEALLNDEMEKLYANMEDQIKHQDEEFINKMGPPKK